MNIWDLLRYKAKQDYCVAATFVGNDRMHLLGCDKSGAVPQIQWQETLVATECPISQQLQRLVKKKQLYRQWCHWVLMPSDYRLLLVELPNVQAEELQAALKWQIMELVDEDLEQCVIDYYTISGPSHRASMAYVVVAPLPPMIKKVAMLEEAGLQPAVIDIQELAVRNVLMGLPTAQDSILFIGLFGKQALLMVCCQAQIYLIRRLTWTVSSIVEQARWADTVAAIGKEIERTNRYCEDQLEIAAPTQLVVWHETMAEAMVEALQPLPGEPLSIHPWLAKSSSVCADETLILLGGALRGR